MLVDNAAFNRICKEATKIAKIDVLSMDDMLVKYVPKKVKCVVSMGINSLDKHISLIYIKNKAKSLITM